MQFGGSKKTQLLLVVFVVLFVSGLAMIIASTLLNTEGSQLEATPHNTNQYFDPVTKQTISDPEGITPEQYGTENHSLLLIGFEELDSGGISHYQRQVIDESLEDFMSKLKENTYNEISLYPGSTTRTRSEKVGILDTVTFKIRADRRADLAVTVTNYSLSESQVEITNGDETLYSSGRIDAYEQDHNTNDRE